MVTGIPWSRVAGVRWPAMPSREGAALLALAAQLEESAWWAADVLGEKQRGQLGALLRHAAESTPHYASALGHVADVDLSRVPVMSRQTLAQRSADLISRKYPKQHGSASASASPVVRSGVSATFASALGWREHGWHQRDFSARLAEILPLAQADAIGARAPDGVRVEGWGPATDALYPTAPLSLLDVEATIEEQLTWLAREEPAYLRTEPSNLRALLAQGVAVPSLRQVMTVGEPVSPETRARCREVFGVSVADVYARAEVGVIAFTCPEEERHHVQAEHLLLEVLDDYDRGCAPGEAGRVVVTDLHNFAMPLIRLDVGDEASFGEPCQCGRGLPVIEGVASRGET